jgi:hypothetical protein
MGPPSSPSGRIISANTYLRSAWFFAGIRLASVINFGHGVLHESFQRAIDQSVYKGAKVKSTHSAVLDLYFAFGFPALIFLFTPLVFSQTKLFQVGTDLNFIYCMIGIVLAVLLLITEVNRQHALETIIYFVAFLRIAENK